MRTIFLLIDIPTFLLLCYCWLKQFEVYKETANGLRNSRKAMMLILKILILIMLQKIAGDLTLSDIVFEEAKIIGIINRFLWLCLALTYTLVHRFYSFHVFSTVYWKGLLERLLILLKIKNHKTNLTRKEN